jgi:hypothetical protein
LSVLLAALELSVLVVDDEVDESDGAVLFNVDDGSLVVDVVLAGIDWVDVVLFVVVADVSAGTACVVVAVLEVVVDVSVDWATAAPMPATKVAAAATADNFFR